MSAEGELRAEVERLRAESEERRRYLLATLQRENEVRRDLANLRARVRALADRADPDGDRAHEGRITPAQVRAVLAGSGEQPGELREASGTCYSDECREPCQSQQRQARAELHEARAELAKVSTRLGEARRALADLRGRIEALADTKPGATGRALRALLGDVANSGPEVEHACGNCEGIDPPSCINYPPPALATNGPAPVVPDSAGLRERVVDALVMSPLADTAGTELLPFRIAADRVLAVVGQGVTAEPVAVVERIHEDRPVITARVYAPESWKHLGLGTHLHAAVRPTGQEGAGR